MDKVVHMTSVHARHDSRIFGKQCRFLAERGFDVTLIVADGKGPEVADGVRIVDVGMPRGRLGRVLNTTRDIYRAGVALDADLYQLHDPELIPSGLRLKRRGKKVVFDSHEDVPKQLLNKPYLGPMPARVLSTSYGMFERYACARFDGIISATPIIRDKFLRINPSTIDVNNFPIVEELHAPIPWPEKRMEVCYVGGIARIRGIAEIVRAIELATSPVRLNLAGEFLDPALEEAVRAQAGWSRVNAFGHLDRAGVRGILQRSMAGLVTLHPTPSYREALPVKMFEYMCAGIPVIASDFPLWRGIVDDAGCGICVDPLDPQQIAAAIDYLVAHPEAAQRMGAAGRDAVLRHYNWTTQASRLAGFYRTI